MSNIKLYELQVTNSRTRTAFFPSTSVVLSMLYTLSFNPLTLHNPDQMTAPKNM